MRRVGFGLLPVVLGCYSYAPLETSRLQPGESVRVRINAQTAEQIEPLLGRTDARLLAGTLITAGDTLIVEVPTTTQLAGGGTFQTLHQRVSIPRTSLLEVESRRLHRGRTAIVAGVAAVALGAAILNATIEKAGKEQPPTGGGPAELRPPPFQPRP